MNPWRWDDPRIEAVTLAQVQAFDVFRQRITELVTTLSELEDRRPVAVLEEILDSSSEEVVRPHQKAGRARK